MRDPCTDATVSESPFSNTLMYDYSLGIEITYDLSDWIKMNI